MKNIIYAGVIGVSVIVAAVVFLGGGSDEGAAALTDEDTMWVKCVRCNAAYEMGQKSFYEQLEEKTKANPTPMPVAQPIACRECGKDGIVEAVKCEKCGEVFRKNSVPNDFPDRCPKCKHSATEAAREARKREMGQ